MSMKRREFLQLLGAGAIGACTRPEPTTPVSQANSSESVRIDVWHDTVCPWCRIGLHNLETVATAWRGAPLEIVLHPFLLEPDAPLEGSDLRARLGAKYGADQLDRMFERVSRAGAPYGVTFAWDKVRLAPQTAPSHVLLEWSPGDRRFDVLDRLHRAHFEEGRNIGDVAVLSGIVRELGLDVASAGAALRDDRLLIDVRVRADAAAREGIRGVPNFRIGRRTIDGAQSPDVIRGAIEEAARG